MIELGLHHNQSGMSQTIPESMSSSRFASRTTNSFTELLSSVNVNDYIQSQLLCMQMCPAKTLSYEKICQLCEFVRKNFSRIPTVHLLEMLNEVRAHNYAKANEAVQLFFDWIVIHGFEKYTPSMLKELDKDQRVLKYALILRARLARKFGYFERAHRYIMEAIQKAQSNDDYICLRLALVVQAESELNTLGLALTPTSTVFESHMPGFSYEGCLNRLKSLVSLQDDLPYESSRTSTDLKYAQEFSSQCHQVMNLIKAIFLTMKCENIEKVNEYLRECLSADLGIDRSPPGRMLHYAARATQSTLQLSLGFSSNSNILSQDSMLMKVLGSSNFYDTESHAIMSVNVAYSLAYDGKFNEAILVIEELKKRFPEDAYPSGAKHWRLAEACLRFDRAVFLGHFNEANCIIEQHEPHYEMEIRKAILSGITGNLKQMQEKIESMSDMLNSFNVLLRIRTSLVLSQLYSFSGTPIQAIDLLTASLELARAHQLHNFVPMILRRLVYAQMLLRKHEVALQLIEQLEEISISRCPRLEKGLIYFTKFDYFAKRYEETNQKQFSEDALRNMLIAISIFRDTQFPLIEKNLYQDAAHFIHRVGKQKLRNRFAELYHRLNRQYLKNLDWHMI